MRKLRTIYIALMFLFSFNANAQIEFHYNGQIANYSYSVDSSNMSNVNASFNFKKDFYIINTGSTPIRVEYSRTALKKTAGWTEEQICDAINCYTLSSANYWTRPLSSSQFAQLWIAGGDSSLFQLKIQPNLIEGCVKSKYKLTDVEGGIVYDSLEVEYILGTQQCVLSIENGLASKVKVSVYPNPVNTELTIAISNFKSNSNFTLFDITGKQIIKNILFEGKNKVDMSKLKGGIYFYTIKHDNQIIETKKLIVQ